MCLEQLYGVYSIVIAISCLDVLSWKVFWIRFVFLVVGILLCFLFLSCFCSLSHFIILGIRHLSTCRMDISFVYCFRCDGRS